MSRCLVGLPLAILLAAIGQVSGAIYLDADTAATGSLLTTQPLVTAYGTITYAGLIGPSSDVDATALGASGSAFTTNWPAPLATLAFDFDVSEITLLYGGNAGAFTIVAKDASDAIVDSYVQAWTGYGNPAGPLLLSADAIRSIQWHDSFTNYDYSFIDNVTITPAAIPEPSTLAIWSLMGLSFVGIGWYRRRKAA